jgi:hypothetical protein
VRRRPIFGLVPVLVAGVAVLASPPPALAAPPQIMGIVAETGTTTYVVNAAKSEIDVTVQLSIKNNTPPTVEMVPCGWSTCPQTTNYYSSITDVAVPIQAGAVKATSNAGKVKQSLVKTTPYERDIQLTYPKLYYRRTRVVTVTYAIPAAPHAPGGYRALKAYAALCAFGNGVDSGAVNVVVPDGFLVAFTSGTNLSKSGDAKGLQTYGSGTVAAPYTFWTCLEATNPANLTSTTVTGGDQVFNIRAWPEDTAWASSIGADVQSDVQKLEDLTGLHMPAGTITLREAGNLELGGYGGSYDSTTKTAAVIEGANDAMVAQELSWILYDPIFEDIWMKMGFADYSEKVAGAGNYTPCTEPGSYPRTFSPDLTTWRLLDINSTTVDRSIAQWQYAASCYLITELADTMGQASFKAILGAAARGEIAYLGATPPELASGGARPISAKTLLDLIDERGMVPAGVTDLDQAQKIFASYGAITADELGARSQARSNYHQLLDTAGLWKMPLAVRSPMASWNFPTAQTAMATVTQILTLRDQAGKNLPGLILDGTALQTQFETAQTQSDLAAVLTLAKNEADAAAKVAQARQLNDGSHSLLQTIGLIGTDLSAPLAQANTALKNAKPADASVSAQKVIDAINGSSDQGLIRAAALIGLPLALLLLVLFVRSRRRHAVALLVPAGGPLDAAVVPSPPGVEAMVWDSAPPGPTNPEPVAPASVAPTGPGVTDRLRQLQEAHDAGLISDDEFAAKRDELLQGL